MGKLWADAVEVMLCSAAVGTDILLVPAATPATPLLSSRSATALPPPLPPQMHSHVIFALTAFDPPGEERTLTQNREANGELYARILETLSPSPASVWPTWYVQIEPHRRHTPQTVNDLYFAASMRVAETYTLYDVAGVSIGQRGGGRMASLSPTQWTSTALAPK